MNRVRKAFTLVEILIVVIILGILAAIVVPQFTSASEEAQLSNVESQLQTIRNQVELFRVRNNGDYPALVAGATGELCWVDLLGDDYLRNPPVNPRTNSSLIVLGAAAAYNADAGWIWDSATGTLRATCLSEISVDAGATETVWMPAP